MIEVKRGGIGCGVSEMFNLYGYDDKEMWLRDFKIAYDRADYRGAFVVFADNPATPFGQEIADYIEANELGKVVSFTGLNPNYMPQAKHMATLWVWQINRGAVDAAYNAIEKNKALAAKKLVDTCKSIDEYL